MKVWIIVVGVLAAIGLLVLGTVGAMVGTYNSLNKEKNGVEAQSKQVDVEYQRAFRLVPQLTALAQQYMANETDVQKEVAALRSGLSSAQNGTLQAKDNYTAQFAGFVALVGNRAEAYPTLRSLDLYQTLMDEITNTENKITAEKVLYNEAVQGYNTHRTTCCLPILIANMFGFHTGEYIGFPDRPNQSSFGNNTL